LGLNLKNDPSSFSSRDAIAKGQKKPVVKNGKKKQVVACQHN
jgi:hypothetical protein